MDKPAPTRTVTIKGMNVDAWEKARQAAAKRGETQGEWLSRACEHQANLERGDVVIPPPAAGNTAAAEPTPRVDLPAIAATIHALGAAGVPIQKRVGRQVNALLHQHLAAALPAPPPRADKALAGWIEAPAGDAT